MTDRVAPHGVQELLKTLQRLSVNEIDDMLQDAKTPEPAPGDLVWYSDVEALLRTLLIPQEEQPRFKGHIDPDCEVVRGVGWMCSCETPEEKAERVRERQECEAEREALPTPPKESA